MPSIKTNRELLKRVSDSTPAPQQAPTVQSPTFPNTPNPWQRGPLPPPMIQSSDQQRGWQISSVPTVRVSPLPPAANPNIGAAAQSQVIVSQPATTTSSGTVSLIVPSIFTPTTQTKTLPGPLNFDLADENLGTVLGVPNLQFQQTGTDVVTSSTGINASVVSLSITPVLDGDYALVMGVGAGSTSAGAISAPAGFTLLDASTGLSGMLLSGTDSITVSASATLTGVNQFISGALVLLNTGGLTPTVVQHNGTSGGFSANTTASATLSSSVTANNSILVITSAAAGSYGTGSLGAGFGTVSDNKGNTYRLLTQTAGGGGAAGVFTQVILQAWISTGVKAGSTTVSCTITGTAGSVLAGVNVTAYEISGVLAASSHYPRFLDPFSVIGPIDLGAINVGGGIKSLLGLANGGTNSNLSATGGTNQLLFQQSAGAPITVGAYDYDKFPGQAVAVMYNNVSLVSNGLPSETGTLNLTALTADLMATTLGTGPGTGFYRVTFYAIVTATAGVSSTLPSIVLTWLDPGNTTSQTMTIPPATPNGNSLTTYVLGTVTVNHKPGAANLSIATTGYASSGAPPMAFDIHARVEALGF